MRSLAEKGTAASAPSAPPEPRRRSRSRAHARAPRASSAANGLKGSALRQRESSRSIISVADLPPNTNERLISRADHPSPRCARMPYSFHPSAAQLDGRSRLDRRLGGHLRFLLAQSRRWPVASLGDTGRQFFGPVDPFLVGGHDQRPIRAVEPIHDILQTDAKLGLEFAG